jgi:predicted nuclease of predicted toxin-antitoxin system
VRILLDECVPARLKRAFPDHAVQSVTRTSWRTSKDGPLLSFAAGKVRPCEIIHVVSPGLKS